MPLTGKITIYRPGEEGKDAITLMEFDFDALKPAKWEGDPQYAPIADGWKLWRFKYEPETAPITDND